MTFFENFKSDPRPAYAAYVITDDAGGDAQYVVTGWGVMDRRDPAHTIVSGLTEQQAAKIADYLNKVTGALT